MQGTTFYEQLQNCKELDSRDPRAKIHNLAFILLGLTLSLLRKERDVYQVFILKLAL